MRAEAPWKERWPGLSFSLSLVWGATSGTFSGLSFPWRFLCPTVTSRGAGRPWVGTVWYKTAHTLGVDLANPVQTASEHLKVPLGLRFFSRKAVWHEVIWAPGYTTDVHSSDLGLCLGRTGEGADVWLQDTWNWRLRRSTGTILWILASCCLRQNLFMWPRSEISIFLCQPSDGITDMFYFSQLAIFILFYYFILFM